MYYIDTMIDEWRENLTLITDKIEVLNAGLKLNGYSHLKDGNVKKDIDIIEIEHKELLDKFKNITSTSDIKFICDKLSSINDAINKVPNAEKPNNAGKVVERKDSTNYTIIFVLLMIIVALVIK
jgi:hypothetical protein